MSRIGKNPVEIPDGTEVTINGQLVSAKGKLGELSFEVAPDIEVTQDGNLISVARRTNNRTLTPLWGTC